METTLFKPIQFVRVDSDSGNSLSPACVRAIAFTLIAACAGPAANCKARTIFETATLGTTGVAGTFAIYDRQFLGVRFELESQVTTTSIGGHFDTEVVSGNNQFFGAIIALADANDFPDSPDLTTPDVLGVALLEFPNPSAEISAPLPTNLSPGHYALLFGAGLFGATGSGSATINNNTVGNPSLISYNPPPENWRNVGEEPFLDGMRFFITGVPEPSTTGLLATAALGAIAFRRSRRRFGSLGREQSRAPLLPNRRLAPKRFQTQTAASHFCVGCIVSAGLLGSATSALAETISAVEVVGSDGFSSVPLQAQVRGWQFEPAARDIVVTHLGMFDAFEDGLVDPRELFLWEADGTLIAQATIPEGTGTLKVDGFRYVPITPVLLNSFSPYVVGYFSRTQEGRGGGPLDPDPDFDWTAAGWPGIEILFSQDVWFVASRSSSQQLVAPEFPSFLEPLVVFSMGASFRYRAVPEPSSTVLCGFATFLLVPSSRWLFSRPDRGMHLGRREVRTKKLRECVSDCAANRE